MNKLIDYGILLEEQTGHLIYQESYAVPDLEFELTYVRHGQTYANVDICFQGQADEKNRDGTGYNQLTELGRDQAESAADDLVSRGENYDVILSSPLSRAYDTAMVYARRIGAEVIKIDALKEIDFGEWDNHQLISVPVDLVEDAQKYLAQNALKSAPSGESFYQLLLRAADIIDSFNRAYSGKKVLVFAHGTLGNAIRIIRHQLKIGDCGYLEWGNSKNMLPNAKPVKIR